MQLNDRLKKLVNEVPKNSCGVYYLYNDKHDIIYIGKTKSSCFQYSLDECNGACINQEDAKLYNTRVRQYLKTVHLPKKDILLELEGRTEHEKGIALIEKGVYKGFGYCDKLLKNIDEIKYCIELKQDNKDVRKILFRHLKAELTR